jgi:hypothetical protein
MESLAGKLSTPLWLISYLYDNCFIAILGDRKYLQKNMAETFVLLIPEALFQPLAIAAGATRAIARRHTFTSLTH